MTPSIDRPNTALLVIDVQRDVVAAAHDRDGVIERMNLVIAKARAAGVLVVWVQHDDEGLPRDTDGWQIVDELQPLDGDARVYKNFRDSFEQTTLEDELAAGDIGRLVVMGAQTDFCVRWTLHGALNRGYSTVLVGDAHTTDAESPGDMPPGAELIAHTNSIWASQDHPSQSAGVTSAADIAFAAT